MIYLTQVTLFGTERDAILDELPCWHRRRFNTVE